MTQQPTQTVQQSNNNQNKQYNNATRISGGLWYLYYILNNNILFIIKRLFVEWSIIARDIYSLSVVTMLFTREIFGC